MCNVQCGLCMWKKSRKKKNFIRQVSCCSLCLLSLISVSYVCPFLCLCLCEAVVLAVWYISKLQEERSKLVICHLWTKEKGYLVFNYLMFEIQRYASSSLMSWVCFVRCMNCPKLSWFRVGMRENLKVIRTYIILEHGYSKNSRRS